MPVHTKYLNLVLIAKYQFYAMQSQLAGEFSIQIDQMNQIENWNDCCLALHQTPINVDRLLTSVVTEHFLSPFKTNVSQKQSSSVNEKIL